MFTTRVRARGRFVALAGLTALVAVGCVPLKGSPPPPPPDETPPPADGTPAPGPDPAQHVVFDDCTLGPQLWTIPPRVHEATFNVYGAEGGAGEDFGFGGGPGGLGARTTAYATSLHPGETLQINVGCMGKPGTSSGGAGGLSSGGDGGAGNSFGSGGGGGGASDVRVNVFGVFSAVIVAGGGGGGGGDHEDEAGGAGGSGGGTTGGDGGDGALCTGGAGSHQFGPGTAGTGCDGGSSGNQGAARNGGDAVASGVGGGGGGGGRFGGGSGGGNGLDTNAISGAGGGGGGAGFFISPYVGSTMASGVHHGDGLVTIDFEESPAPAVTELRPISGPAEGGTRVAITGTDLYEATAVHFGATPASSFNPPGFGGFSMNAVAPPGVGIVDVTVTTPSGTSANTGADDYRYVSVPEITSVDPPTGTVHGGETVTITGTSFTDAASLSFGGTAISSYVVDSDTQITAITPPHAAGIVDVSVTTPAGSSANTPNDDYAYFPVPSVLHLSPSVGPVAGGTPVTITGSGLTDATAVSFGGTAATSFVVNSDNEITTTAPAHAAGTVQVRVTNPVATGSNPPNDNYRYAPVPAVTGVDPSAGPQVGGNTVTITGTGFTEATAVMFGTNAGTNVNVMTDGVLTVRVPAGTGQVNVRVTTPGGQSPTNGPSDLYSYAPVPTVTGLSANEGPEAGANTVVITGTGFSGAGFTTNSVIFGSAIVSPGDFTVDSDTKITVTDVPAGTGAVSVRVNTPGGMSATNPPSTTYTYIPAPTVTAVNPNTGPATGGTPITITGTNFTSGSTPATVTVGGKPCSFVNVVNATTITCAAPTGAGTVSVRVITNGGTSANTANDDYTYVP